MKLLQTGLILSSATMFLRPVAAQQFIQVNLVTDDQTAHAAVIQDPALKNAWGVSFGGTTPFWVSDNGTGVSTLYKVDPATDLPTKQGLTVTIPGDGSVTGQTFNPLSAIGAFNGDLFMFVSEDGTISGWRGALATTAERFQVADPANVYKGTTAANVGGHEYLYSANFKSGNIDVLKGDAAAPDLSGKFTDPNLPASYAPFNIRALNGKMYVTYALQDGKDDAPGAGHGFVNEFDLQGNLLRRIGTMGSLNSPWGLEIAPATFDAWAGDLLVGNFGDGRINAFDLKTGTFAGQLRGSNGNPLEVDGLWALTVGNEGSGGSRSKLYFTAGPDEESHGLFGLLALPDNGSTASLLASGFTVLALARKKRSV